MLNGRLDETVVMTPAIKSALIEVDDFALSTFKDRDPQPAKGNSMGAVFNFMVLSLNCELKPTIDKTKNYERKKQNLANDFETHHSGKIERMKEYKKHDFKCDFLEEKDQIFSYYDINFNSCGLFMEKSNNNSLGILDLERYGKYYKNIFGITMFNEGPEELDRTLKAILKNQPNYREKTKVSPSRNLAIIIIDGVGKIEKTHKDEKLKVDHPTLQYHLRRYRLYDSNTIKEFMISQDELEISDKAYVFESRLILKAGDLKPEPEYEQPNRNSNKRELNIIPEFVPGPNDGLDVLCVIKPKNMRKLHSHLWLYYGFCNYFKPEYCFLIDVGTKPFPNALVELTMYMDNKKSCSGACGEIMVHKPNTMIEKAQWFEYKISHALLKTFESASGFIPVLPGAFSVYRWTALLQDDFSVLKHYFKPFLQPEKMRYLDWNIYMLAEDRVKADQIVKMRTPSYRGNYLNHGHYLKFVKKAKAHTEGQPTLKDLIAQRRRWNNGSWFALVRIILFSCNIKDILTSSHHCVSQIFLMGQIMYYTLILFFTWFALGAYYLAYSMAVRKIVDKEHVMFDTAQFLFLFVQLVVIIFSLSIKLDYVPKIIWKLASLFYFLSFVFILSVLFIYSLLFDDINSEIAEYAVYVVAFVVVVSLFLYWENFKECIFYVFPYIYYLPTYVNILLLFSVARADDISWGTRLTKEQSKKNPMYNLYKAMYLTSFIVSNVAFGLMFEYFDEVDNSYMDYLYVVAGFIVAIPLVGEVVYLCRHFVMRYDIKRIQPGHLVMGFTEY